jgi:hypothetical protein
MERRIEGHTKFWEHLVEDGVLDRELAEEFESSAQATWTPIGKLLVTRGALTMTQLMGLLAMQAGDPGLRLGDLAVREGLCSLGQIREVLSEQRRLCPHPIETLLGDDRVDTGALLTPLVRYVRWLEGQLHTLREAAESSVG